MEQMSKACRFEVEKLTTLYDVKKSLILLKRVGIDSSGGFDPKIIFAQGSHDGVNLCSNDNFKNILSDSPEVPDNIFLPYFNVYKNKRSIYDDGVIREINSNTVIGISELFSVWRTLIFAQAKGEKGVLNNVTYSNVWYVLCSDGVVRVFYIAFRGGMKSWYLACDELNEIEWSFGKESGTHFFIPIDIHDNTANP